MRCQGKTQEGKRCHRQCTNDRYCWQHQMSENTPQFGGRLMTNYISPKKFSKPTKGAWDVYGKGYCPYTQGALNYLLNQSVPKLIFYDINKLSPPLTTQQAAKKLKVNHSSVPMIFNPNNKFIGGFSDLKP